MKTFLPLPLTEGGGIFWVPTEWIPFGQVAKLANLARFSVTVSTLAKLARLAGSFTFPERQGFLQRHQPPEQVPPPAPS
jgi:hypothetical protein